ncbi:hypothetical protein [Streptomyces roseolilacinus]|uniref:hypothetical protein n=1 Tax=Streptomyces roseolilacinus TaxID=66904 RepID=UPI00381C6E18
MADDDFYTHDRPDDAKLPEDRPRGGAGPGGSSGKRARPIWIIVGAVAVVIVLLALFMP